MGRDPAVPVTRAPGPVPPGFPETRGLWQGRDAQNSPREASPGRDLPPHLGSAPHAFPAAPPLPPLNPGRGGCGGPTSLRGPPGGSSPRRDGFGSDCHITRCYIPPWGLGPGPAGRGRQYVSGKKRAGRSWKSNHSEPPRENTGTVSRDLSSRGRLRLRLLTRPQGRARPQSLLSLSSLRTVWQRSRKCPEAVWGDPQEPWCHPPRPGSRPSSARGRGGG